MDRVLQANHQDSNRSSSGCRTQVATSVWSGRVPPPCGLSSCLLRLLPSHQRRPLTPILCLPGFFLCFLPNICSVQIQLPYDSPRPHTSPPMSCSRPVTTPPYISTRIMPHLSPPNLTSRSLTDFFPGKHSPFLFIFCTLQTVIFLYFTVRDTCL